MIHPIVADKAPTNFSQQKIKASNTMLLFNIIRKTMPTSRATLATQTNLSPTTVSMLVDELIQNKWIRETGAGASTMRGRKPIMLEVNAAGGCIATVEIISHSFICSLYDICFRKLGSVRIHGATHTSEQISVEIKKLLKAKRIPMYRLIGIHLIFPGIFDAETGYIQFSAVIPAEELTEADLVAQLREKFPDSRVLMSNNTSVLAFMEYSSDDYSPEKRVLAINIDEGISAGVVLGDAHKDPAQCFSPEIGHIIVDRNGPMCRCSNRGCLESICSTAALFRALNERAGLHLTYNDCFAAQINEVAMREVAARFLAHEPAVLEVLNDYVYALCCGLVSAINLYDVHVIHIGGSITMLGEGFLDMVRKTIHSQFRLLHAQDVAIEASSGDFETLRRSAVMMSMDEIFKNEQS